MSKKSPRKEFTLVDQQLREIACYSWKPRKIKAQIVLVHGFSEHCRNYFSLGDELCEQGLAVHMMDLPGHGASKGRRGDIKEFQEYIDNLDWFLEKNPHFLPEKETFLLGHSLGGLISSLYCLRNQQKFSGLILSAPLTGLSFIYSKILYWVGKGLRKKFPIDSIPKVPRPQALCRDMEKWDDYYSDPFRLNTISMRLFLFMVEQTAYLQRFASYLELPLLVFMARDDAVVSSEAIQKFFTRTGSEDKTLVVFSEAYHELFQEVEKPQVVRKMLDWVENRIKD